MKLVRVATCSLDQWAMDFEGNCNRIIASIQYAKLQGCTYRIGPELEITGYSCEDHFHEMDTFTHSWEVLAEILKYSDGILCDIGMPVMHNAISYNCRVFCLNGKILLIRPKKCLADDGNYREGRYFTEWRRDRHVEPHSLPEFIQSVTDQKHAPFGDGVLEVGEIIVGTESCEELFTPNSPHISLGLAGVDIIGNGSGSHHQLRKLNTRVQLITEATTKGGGVYLYSNQQGCDGNRLYFDGCAMILVNGRVVAQGSQFSLKDVEVLTAVVDVDDVRSIRASVPSRAAQAAVASAYPRITVEGLQMIIPEVETFITDPSPYRQVQYHCVEEEIALGPACWLWDYLRRTGAAGYFLPLSGGADSSATAAIVASMCKLVVEACTPDAHGIYPSRNVLNDVRRIVGEAADPKAKPIRCRDDSGMIVEYPGGYVPKSPQELAGRVFFTAYMGTKNSSDDTKQRATDLASDIGCTHLSVVIDPIIHAIVTFFKATTGFLPKFQVEGGSMQEDLALQNIQARTRMVISYFFAQLILWTRDRQRAAGLLVLGSANVDEALRGYLTKYDCSSADINPIGGISKVDLKRFLQWGSANLNLPSLVTIYSAHASAELRPKDPNSGNANQVSEDEMGMTFTELQDYGRLRKIERCGPMSMFQKLVHMWRDSKLSPKEICEKVKLFFRFYAINRHKVTVLTPSYHAESYSPEDNRFDLRQFLYNVRWPWQFQKMDELAQKMTDRLEKAKEEEK